MLRRTGEFPDSESTLCKHAADCNSSRGHRLANTAVGMTEGFHKWCGICCGKIFWPLHAVLR